MILIEIAGFLGRDAEERFTPSGEKVVTLNVATKIRQSGKDETVWWSVSIWGDRFNKMIPYFKKGTGLIIVGELRKKPEIYTDKNGQQQVSLSMNAEVIKFSPFGKPEKAEGSTTSTATPHYQPPSGGGEKIDYGVKSSVEFEEAFAGDDLPF